MIQFLLWIGNPVVVGEVSAKDSVLEGEVGEMGAFGTMIRIAVPCSRPAPSLRRDLR